MMISKRAKRRLNAKARENAHTRVGPLAADFLIVVDVEATCEKKTASFPYAHEIIEFPAVLVRCSDGELVSEFHSYVRPTVNTTLSAFCTDLTGITQEQVDSAPVLEEVLLSFDEWIKSHGLIFPNTKNSRNEQSAGVSPINTLEEEAEVSKLATFALATDGPWDLNHFLSSECQRLGGTIQEWHAQQEFLHTWVNLRWLHAEFYNKPRMGVSQCLKFHKLEFQGRQHSGIDDSRNIARIASILIKDGCTMPLNDGLAEDVAVSWRWGKGRKHRSSNRASRRGSKSTRRERAKAASSLKTPKLGSCDQPRIPDLPSAVELESALLAKRKKQ